MVRRVVRKPRWCRCKVQRSEGYTRRDDGVWVHPTCMLPSKGNYDALRQAEAEAS